MAKKTLLYELTEAQKATFDTVASRIKETSGVRIKDELEDDAVYDIGDTPEVGFGFYAKDNANLISTFRSARDDLSREVFAEGDRAHIFTGHFSLCDVAAAASKGVAFREINYKNFADLTSGPSDYVPMSREDRTAWKHSGNSFGRLHLNLSSLHFTLAKPPEQKDTRPGLCDAHIDHTGFMSDFGSGYGMTPDFGWHTANELVVGVGFRALIGLAHKGAGDWVGDHFRFVMPSSETKYVNEFGVSLQFRPSDNVTIELYATNKGILQEKPVFVNFDRLSSLPTNYGINLFGNFDFLK